MSAAGEVITMIFQAVDQEISDIACRQINRRRADYQAISIFTQEDLEQEIWSAVLGEFTEAAIKQVMATEATRRAAKAAEMIARRGYRVRKKFTELTEQDIEEIDSSGESGCTPLWN
jgi:hypothetical protein